MVQNVLEIKFENINVGLRGFCFSTLVFVPLNHDMSAALL